MKLLICAAIFVAVVELSVAQLTATLRISIEFTLTDVTRLTPGLLVPPVMRNPPLLTRTWPTTVTASP